MQQITSRLKSNSRMYRWKNDGKQGGKRDYPPLNEQKNVNFRGFTICRLRSKRKSLREPVPIFSEELVPIFFSGRHVNSLGCQPQVSKRQNPNWRDFLLKNHNNLSCRIKPFVKQFYEKRVNSFRYPILLLTSPSTIQNDC